MCFTKHDIRIACLFYNIWFVLFDAYRSISYNRIYISKLNSSFRKKLEFLNCQRYSVRWKFCLSPLVLVQTALFFVDFYCAPHKSVVDNTLKLSRPPGANLCDVMSQPSVIVPHCCAMPTSMSWPDSDLWPCSLLLSSQLWSCINARVISGK